MLLTRTLEPEVMDSPDEAAAYDQMDHRQVNQTFVDDLLRFATVDGEVLDLGTGTARIPIELCRRDESLRVVAADLAVAMLDLGRINIEIANLTQRILLVHLDAKRLDLADGRFALVISNSLIHHLAEPLEAVREAVRVTAPDGRLFVRDLLRPSTASEVDRLVDAYAPSESQEARRLFHNSLYAALNLAEIRQLVSQLGFSAETVQATSDRHWTWAARMNERRP
jgi:ubiquinone/menaquinone biosynthesis C-methylase UbiE